MGKKKRYAFEVPMELSAYVKKGNTVVCNTSKGVDIGITTTGVIYGPGAADIAEMNGAEFPLSTIIGVWSDIPMRTIQVPMHFKHSLPCAEKLQQRMDEYHQNQSFRTRIELDADGVLKDGYSAYCVAKLLDLEVLPVYIEIKKEEEETPVEVTQKPKHVLTGTIKENLPMFLSAKAQEAVQSAVCLDAALEG
jgi:hypothetical protein